MVPGLGICAAGNWSGAAPSSPVVRECAINMQCYVFGSVAVRAYMIMCVLMLMFRRFIRDVRICAADFSRSTYSPGLFSRKTKCDCVSDAPNKWPFI